METKKRQGQQKKSTEKEGVPRSWDTAKNLLVMETRRDNRTFLFLVEMQGKNLHEYKMKKGWKEKGHKRGRGSLQKQLELGSHLKVVRFRE